MSSYFRRQLADYVEYHRDPWNCAMHVFGIVFLFLAAVLPLSLWSITVVGIQTSVATTAVVRCRDRQSCDKCCHVVTYGDPDCYWRRIADYRAPRVRAKAAGACRQS